MSKPSSMDTIASDLGATAVVLGIVGAVLFILPILAVPLAAIGLLFGLVALGLALFRNRRALGWSAVGVAVSALALAIGLGVAHAPADFLPSRRAPLDTSPVVRPLYVPPPARPGSVRESGAATERLHREPALRSPRRLG